MRSPDPSDEMPAYNPILKRVAAGGDIIQHLIGFTVHPHCNGTIHDRTTASMRLRRSASYAIPPAMICSIGTASVVECIKSGEPLLAPCKLSGKKRFCEFLLETKAAQRTVSFAFDNRC